MTSTRWSIACLAVSVVAVWPDASEATSIVTAWVGGKVYMAADSKISGDNAASPSCKIRQGRGCFYAIKGPFRGVGVDVYQLADTSCRIGKDMDDIVRDFNTRIRLPFVSLYRHARERYPESEPLARNLELHIVGRQARGLTVMVTGYHMRKMQHAELLRRKKLPRDGWLVRDPTPASDHIKAQYPLTPPYGTFVERFIQAEIDSGRADVGPPITVIEIDASGARWIRQNNCPSINLALWQ